MSLIAAQAAATANYPLDESSGSAIDSIGALDFSQTGTVGTRTEDGHPARDFTGSSSNYLSRADDDVFEPGSGNWFAVVFVKLDSTANQIIAAHKDNGSGDSWYIALLGNRFYVGVRQSNNTMRETEATNFGAPTTGVTYVILLQLVQDGGTNELRIYVNGTAETATSFTGPAIASSGIVTVGIDGDASSLPFDGAIWDLTVGPYLFTTQDVADLWNSGSPRLFADWDTAPGGGNAPRAVHHMCQQGMA